MPDSFITLKVLLAITLLTCSCARSDAVQNLSTRQISGSFQGRYIARGIFYVYGNYETGIDGYRGAVLLRRDFISHRPDPHLPAVSQTNVAYNCDNRSYVIQHYVIYDIEGGFTAESKADYSPPYFGGRYFDVMISPLCDTVNIENLSSYSSVRDFIINGSADLKE